MPLHIRKLSETAESIFDKRPFYRVTMPCYEERRDGAAWDVPFIALLAIVGETARQSGSDRHQPGSIELTFVDRK